MKTIKVRPVLIESKEPTNIYYWGDRVYYTDNPDNISEIGGYNKIPTQWKQLIFISLEDDKIKEGDLFYTDKSIKICAKYDDCLGYYTDDGNTFLYIQPNHRKVITLQPQIPESYIQQFIEEYNKNAVKDVEIEMIESNIVSNYEFDGTNDGELNWEYLPKLTNGFVTIVNNRLFNESDINKLSINIEQPLYTEQEVILLLDKFINEYLPISLIDLSHKWFEDHKKK